MEKKHLKWGAFLFGAVSLLSLAFYVFAPQVMSFLTGYPDGDMLCGDDANQRYEECAKNQCVGAGEGRCYLVGCLRPLCPDLRKFALALAVLSGALALYYLSSRKN